jgi:hypothetical protein
LIKKPTKREPSTENEPNRRNVPSAFIGPPIMNSMVALIHSKFANCPEVTKPDAMSIVVSATYTQAIEP